MENTSSDSIVRTHQCASISHLKVEIDLRWNDP